MAIGRALDNSIGSSSKTSAGRSLRLCGREHKRRTRRPSASRSAPSDQRAIGATGCRPEQVCRSPAEPFEFALARSSTAQAASRHSERSPPHGEATRPLRRFCIEISNHLSSEQPNKARLIVTRLVGRRVRIAVNAARDYDWFDLAWGSATGPVHAVPGATDFPCSRLRHSSCVAFRRRCASIPRSVLTLEKKAAEYPRLSTSKCAISSSCKTRKTAFRAWNRAIVLSLSILAHLHSARRNDTRALAPTLGESKLRIVIPSYTVRGQREAVKIARLCVLLPTPQTVA